MTTTHTTTGRGTAVATIRQATCPDCRTPMFWHEGEGVFTCDPVFCSAGPLAPEDITLEANESWLERDGVLTVVAHTWRYRADVSDWWCDDCATVTDYCDPTVVHADYPHHPGQLHGCAACEASCHCDPSPGSTECVFEGEHFTRGGDQ